LRVPGSLHQNGTGGSVMVASLLDLIVVLLCPIGLSVAAWVVAVRALAWTDEISDVVQALTGLDGDENKTNARADFSPTRQVRRSARRSKPVSRPQHINAERPSDEKRTVARL
jgi:hypothetical protein